MDGGRRGSSQAIAGLGSACIACVALAAMAALACGDTFTTGSADGGAGGGGNDGGSWCASQDPTHTFCEDFSSGVPDQVSTELIMGGASIEADTTDFTSAPQSLVATTPALTSVGATATAIASRAFSTDPGTHFVLSLDLKVDGGCLPKNDKNGVLVLALEFTEANYEIAIQVLPTEVDVVELSGQTPTALHQFQMTLASGWQRWTLDVNGISSIGSSSAMKTVDLAIGSTSAFKKESLQKAPPLPLQHPTLVVGAIVKDASDQAPACKVWDDDILFDVRTTAAAL